MQGAGAAPEGLAGLHQRVFGVERRAAVRLLVLGAVGGRAGETRAGGGPLDPGADVTPHHLLAARRPRGGGARRRSGPGRRHRKAGGAVASLFELVGDQGEDLVDAELRPLREGVLAERAGAGGAGRPVAADARLRAEDRRKLRPQAAGRTPASPRLPGRSCVHTAWRRARRTGPDRWSR